MTIVGLGQFLKKQNISYKSNIDIETLSNEKIAIDGHQICTSMCKSAWCDFYKNQDDPLHLVLTEEHNKEVKQMFLKKVIEWIVKWLEYSITPIWVFEGKAPELKLAKQQKRQKARETASEKVEKLKSETPEESPEEGEGWMLITPATGDKTRDKAISYLVQEKHLERGWIADLKSLMTELSLPWVQSNTEGERCASMMYHDGTVKSVYSTDMDVIVYGVPKPVCGWEVQTGVKHPTKKGKLLTTIPVYDLPTILDKLELSYEKFLEFCIACECDYNSRPFRKGPAAAIKQIRQFDKIEEFSYDTSSLLPMECRQLFSIVPSEKYITSRNENMEIDWSVLKYCQPLLEKRMSLSDACDLGNKIRVLVANKV